MLHAILDVCVSYIYLYPSSFIYEYYFKIDGVSY
jgi:hypothetical protein